MAAAIVPRGLRRSCDTTATTSSRTRTACCNASCAALISLMSVNVRTAPLTRRSPSRGPTVHCTGIDEPSARQKTSCVSRTVTPSETARRIGHDSGGCASSEPPPCSASCASCPCSSLSPYPSSRAPARLRDVQRPHRSSTRTPSPVASSTASTCLRARTARTRWSRASATKLRRRFPIPATSAVAASATTTSITVSQSWICRARSILARPCSELSRIASVRAREASSNCSFRCRSWVRSVMNDRRASGDASAGACSTCQDEETAYSEASLLRASSSSWSARATSAS